MAINPKSPNPPYEVELIDSKSKRRYGLKVPQGSMQIGTVSQDDTLYIRNVGKRAGDFDEQRSWSGGRGQENFSDNGDAFWDANNAWTLTKGHTHQTLQWYHARGLRSEDMYMPTHAVGNVKFQPLLGSTLYLSNIFSASAAYSADKAYLWIRRRGTPGTLTLKLHSDSAATPGTVLQTVTKTVADITDYVSVYQVFDWTSTQSLSNATNYHISVYGATTDDRDNHWEIGVNPDNYSGNVSTDGSAWTSATFAMYYRITNADVSHRWFRFMLADAMYIIDRKDDGTTASVIYINGDRGKATSATATTITDSTKSWVSSRWLNAYVKITGGTGFGQVRKITANSGAELTVATWDTTPSTDSEFIIYGTEWFTQITPTVVTLGVCSGEPAVVNNVAYIPQSSIAFIRIKWDAATKTHLGYQESAATTDGLADLFIASNDPSDGPVLWRANNNSATGSGGNVTVSRCNLLSSGAFIAYNAAMVWKTAIFTGSTSFRITGLGKKDNQIYVSREDGIGVISNDRFINIETGTEKTPSPSNGKTMVTQGQFLFYSWLHSIVRVYGSSHDDIGDDYRGQGLPDGREGEYSDADTYLKNVLFGIDAGTGVSSVLAWDGLGWHEIIRGRQAGDRIRMVKVQPCQGTHNLLWVNMGGDLVFQEFPYLRASPRLDTTTRYMHEAVIESASIDMGAASGLPKFIKELTAMIRNLNTNGREVYVDVQTDADVHTTNWTPAGAFTVSPESVLFVGLQNVRRFAYRLRLCTNDSSVPIDVEGVIPNGFARTPFKMVFTMQIQAGGVYSRKGKTASSGELMRWLLDSSRQPGRVKMNSIYEMAHDWWVVIHPPRMFPQVPARGRNSEQASFTLVLEEA